MTRHAPAMNRRFDGTNRRALSIAPGGPGRQLASGAPRSLLAVADVEVVGALGLVGVLPGHDHAVAAGGAVAGVIAVGLGDGECGAGLELGEPPGAAVHRDRDDLRRRPTALGERVEHGAGRRAELGPHVVGQRGPHAVLAGVLIAVAVVGDAVAVAVLAGVVAAAVVGAGGGGVVRVITLVVRLAVA